MFEICRQYLKSIANDIGVADVRFKRGSAQSKREVRIFSMPTRGRTEQITNRQGENARQGILDYSDPNDRFPSRTTDVTATDATGNTGTMVKATGANFQTNGVVANDYFHRDDNGKRSKIVSVDDEDTLTISDADITGNDTSFHVSPKDGTPIVKRRVIKALRYLTFVVQFNARTLAIAEVDYNNFMRKVGKFIYDGQFAEYIDEDSGSTTTDSKGNPIRISFGAYEMGDNQYYPELQNSIVQEFEFVGGIYLVPDASSGEISVPAEWVAPEGLVTV